MSLKGLIFDFDGIITDTEPVHMEAWQSVLEPLGILFDEVEYQASYLGLNDRDFLAAVAHQHQHHFDDTDMANLIEEKGKRCIAMLEKEVPLLPGVADFVEAAGKRYPLAICSGAMRSEIEFILRHLKWEGRFKPIISADSVTKGKPDPEGYIRALEGLTERADTVILAREVIALEDSPKGIAAAKAAGLRCLAVGTSFGHDELGMADWTVDSLAGISVGDLQQKMEGTPSN